MTCPDANDLVAYGDGALAGARFQAVDDHLDGCVQCRSLVGELLSARAPVRARAIRPGDTVGRFVVTERLGAGGMGVVFRAHDPELDRDVALKIVRPERGRRHDAEQRLALEAQAIARTSHPNVVSVYAVGTFGRDVYVAMELVPGITLRQWLREQPRDPARILEVFVDAGRGLAAAHAAGVIHRDFKPDNVMISARGQVKVLDFGLAQLGEMVTSGLDSFDSGSGDARLTETGTVMGTVAYMAPEQHHGRLVDARADQYAFAVALWEALTGELPFPALSAAESQAAKHAGAPPTMRKLPRTVARALRRALEPDPLDRFEDMAALLDALAPVTSRRRWLAISGVGACVAVLAWMSVVPPAPECPAAARAEATWGELRRQALSQAFSRSTLGDASWERARERIDDRVEILADVHEQVCLRTIGDELPAAELEAQRICLEARWTELDVLTEAWTQATVAQLADVAVLVAGLDDPRACTDATARAIEASTLATMEEVRALRDAHVALANAHASSKAGRVDEAMEVLVDLRPRVEGLGEPGLTARVIREIGTMHGIRGESAEAERELSAAYELALAHGDDRLATDIAVELVRVVGFGLSRVDDARRWAGHADALVERTGDRAAAAWLEQQRGLLCQLEYDGECALEHHRRAFEELLAVEGYDHIRTTLAMGELGNAARTLGDYLLAVEYAAEAHAMASDVAGLEHPITLQLLGNLGLARLRVGDLVGAGEDLERSREGIERVFGSRHPSYGVTVHMLAEAAWEAGDEDRWLELAQRALELAREAFGDDHLYVAEVEVKLADGLLEMGRVAESCPHWSRAAPMSEKWGGERALLPAAHAHVGLAACRSAAGDRAAAEAALQRAERLLERADGAEDPLEVAEIELWWADVAATVDLDAERIDGMTRRARDHLAEAGEVGLSLGP